MGWKPRIGPKEGLWVVNHSKAFIANMKRRESDKVMNPVHVSRGTSPPDHVGPILLSDRTVDCTYGVTSWPTGSRKGMLRTCEMLLSRVNLYGLTISDEMDGLDLLWEWWIWTVGLDAISRVMLWGQDLKRQTRGERENTEQSSFSTKKSIVFFIFVILF